MTLPMFEGEGIQQQPYSPEYHLPGRELEHVAAGQLPFDNQIRECPGQPRRQREQHGACSSAEVRIHSNEQPDNSYNNPDKLTQPKLFAWKPVMGHQGEPERHTVG
ncbi:hypothetical protein D3C72_823850 [compost metagenome]